MLPQQHKTSAGCSCANNLGDKAKHQKLYKDHPNILIIKTKQLFTSQSQPRRPNGMELAE
jgi:hypothetical protein